MKTPPFQLASGLAAAALLGLLAACGGGTDSADLPATAAEKGPGQQDDILPEKHRGNTAPPSSPERPGNFFGMSSRDLISTYDKDGNQQLSREEFAAVPKPEGQIEQHLIRFEKIDVDADGQLSLKEMSDATGYSLPPPGAEPTEPVQPAGR